MSKPEYESIVEVEIELEENEVELENSQVNETEITRNKQKTVKEKKEELYKKDKEKKEKRETIERLYDISLKIFYSISIGALIYFIYYFYTELLGGTYGGFVWDRYSNFEIIANFGLSMPLLVFTILLINKFEDRKDKGTKIENKIGNALSKIKILEVSNLGFYFICFSYLGFAIYSQYELLILMASSLKLIMGYDLLTFTPMESIHFIKDHVFVLSLINIAFFVLFLITKPKKYNNDVFFGIFILPILIGLIFDINLFSGLSNVEGMPENPLKDLLGINNGVTFFLITGLAYLVLTYLFEVHNKNKKFKKVIKDNISGLVFSKVIIVMASMLFAATSPTIKYVNTDWNLKTVEINNKEYIINQSLISEMDNMETEFLIESYVGLSAHNSHNSIYYLLFNYEGNKDKARKLVSLILLNHLNKIADKYDSLEEIINKPIEASTAINIAIPTIIYEAASERHVGRFLQAAYDEKYQDAIDYFIEDSLNNTTETYSLIYPKESVTSSYGSPLHQMLFANIVSNGLATLDYDKIKDEKIREKFKDIMNEYELDKKPEEVLNPEPNELVEEWFRIFGI